MTQDSSHALVVGAGVGGLAAALALERAGLRVTVVEQAAELRELGFVLLLAPNAMKALRLLGIADRVRERSVVGELGELRRADGSLLRRIDLRAVARAAGEDTVCARRHVLHGALLDALEHTEIRTGAQALGCEQDDQGVTLTLHGGERLHADLLIAADGTHSKLRAALHADPLRASGLIGIRGLCRGASWPITGAQYFGRGLEAGASRAGADAVYWFVAAKQRALPAGLTPQAAALALLRTFDPALRALVEATAPADIRTDELVDRAPLRRWGDRRMTLLGDAAHPMLPHAGQGAAQALEDAAVLGRCVASERDLSSALRRYERLRMPRAYAVVALARRNARAVDIEHRWLCAARDWVIAHGPDGLIEKQLSSLARVELAV